MRSLPSHLEIFHTEDGSPTLVHRRPDGYVEKMHHARGALSESLYIYQQALLKVLECRWPPRILSLGLGLGYNELLSLATLKAQGIQSFKIWSLESEEILREEFRGWAMNAMPESELQQILSQIVGRVSAHAKTTPAALQQQVRMALETRALELRGAFPESLKGIDGCSLVYFDAFSNKMNPELWEEELLVHRLGPHLAKNCVLATYAATGALNRALRALGFRLLSKPGFAGKRESTLAVRTDERP
ncbi:MAG: MnmC family methyltransferase [Bdellovibrionales bacterium]